ncbi:MAG TPA: sigma-70 family RNA polymerase sigma factor [Egibacteraceae bacterium]|nr:sigma-70 family RNA polymerase sigma factor [Egibacteraceae bacterium]
MDGRSDQELVAQLARDADALEEFYRRHVDKVVGFASRRMATPDEVADLAAGVFLAVIDASDRYDPGRGEPVSWLLGIAANQVAAQRRRHARDRRLQERLCGRRLLDADDYERLEARIDAERAARRLYAALQDLPEGEREVMDLVGVEGLTPAAAASALGISPASARMRLARARRKLRRSASAWPPTDSSPVVILGGTEGPA